MGVIHVLPIYGKRKMKLCIFLYTRKIFPAFPGYTGFSEWNECTGMLVERQVFRQEINWDGDFVATPIRLIFSMEYHLGYSESHIQKNSLVGLAGP